jgi:hypothetical protein
MGVRGSRLARVTVVLALVVSTAACGDDDDDAAEQPGTTQAGATQPGVFFGTVGLTTDRIAVAVEAADASGNQRVRAFLSDGEPGGDAEWFEGTSRGGRVELTSASRKARLEARIEPAHATGTVTLADGRARPFHTIPATHGAGIYDVEVTADGRYTGTSTTGNKLEAQQAGNFVEGSLTTPNGDRFMYRVADLSRAFAYPTPGGAPDRYTIVVARYGLAQMGRGGGDALKSGSPGPNLIALDLGASTQVTPGVYYGKVARVTDQFLMVVDQPAGSPSRRVRVYLSDGEAPPEGNIEWFVGSLTGSSVNLTSASRRATFSGEIGSDSVKGTVTLPDGTPRPFFAVPAGDGAGIYEVRVDANGVYRGTAEDGSRFELNQSGENVTGTITTAGGRSISLLAYDLTQVFSYPVKGSQPDTYLAFADRKSVV